jgi:lysozyme
MKLSKAGLAMLKNFEGCELKAYLCPGGVYTIGYGHTGEHVYPGMEIDERTAEKLLLHDVRRFEWGVARLCGDADLSQAQFDALVSLAFNIGLDAFSGSTLLKKIRAGQMAEAADQFLVWDKSGGRALKGLKARRRMERSVFLAPRS